MFTDSHEFDLKLVITELQMFNLLLPITNRWPYPFLDLSNQHAPLWSVIRDLYQLLDLLILHIAVIEN